MIPKRYLLLLLLVLSACNIFGGEVSPLSPTCYTDPQTTSTAQRSLGSSGTVGAQYVPGRLLVSYRSDAALHRNGEDAGTTDSSAVQASAARELRAVALSVRQRYKLQVLETLGSLGDAELVLTPSGADVGALATELSRDPRVAYAEPDYYLYPLDSNTDTPRSLTATASAQTLPNDPRLNEQWNLLNFGLPQAWRLETGEEDIVLAVLDSGIDVKHKDLRGRVLPGCNVFNGDNDLTPDVHGTHVAGIALADGNNAEGVVGVAYTGVRLLPVQVFDDSGGDPQKTATSAVAKAVRWASGMSVKGMNRTPTPANIINLSLGGRGGGPDGTIQTLNDAVKDARDRGVLVIAASGNTDPDDDDPSDGIFSPANAPGALAVGAVDEDFRRSEDSRYSASSRTGRTVDLMAPGGFGSSSCGGVLSTFPPFSEEDVESNYGCEQGTSMASPFVAGVAALIWSQNRELTDNQVEARLRASTKTSDFMNEAEYGAGIVCADRALGAATLCGE